MALLDGLLTPLGLAALLAAIPLVLLYLIRPDPVRKRLPTLRFLGDQRRQDSSNPLLEQLQRNLLLLIQLVAILLFAVSLATPYTNVPERTTVEETVLVVDGSASMATKTGTGAGGGTRFARAVSAAEEAVTSTTSVVFAGASTRVVLQQGPPDRARAALSDLRPTDTGGDLQGAIETAAAIAGENARVVVLSDFADEGWADAVQRARAQGLSVDLRQFAGGGADNVGIVERSFSGDEVTVTVKNFGNSSAERTLRFGNQSTSVSLAPGDVTTAAFTVPAGGGTVELAPGDSFPTDDAAYVAAPSDATIDTLLLTNDRNRYLTAALTSIDEVELTVESPPTSVDATYDVVIYSNVDPDSLLQGNVEAGRDVVADGGGVAIQAQSNMPGTYGDLLPIEPGQVGTNPTVSKVASDELTQGIAFPPPEEYVTGSLQSGSALVNLADGTPLIATATRGQGRVLYYGYIEDASSFKYNYQYPVFWKRAVFYLADRDTLTQLNRDTGGELTFDAERSVETPSGTVTASRVTLDQAGFYAVGDRRLGASLYSAAESDVSAPDLSARSTVDGVATREEERQVPKPLTEWVTLGVLGAVLVELGYLRRRGDL